PDLDGLLGGLGDRRRALRWRGFAGPRAQTRPRDRREMIDEDPQDPPLSRLREREVDELVPSTGANRLGNAQELFCRRIGRSHPHVKEKVGQSPPLSRESSECGGRGTIARAESQVEKSGGSRARG